MFKSMSLSKTCPPWRWSPGVLRKPAFDPIGRTLARLKKSKTNSKAFLDPPRRRKDKGPSSTSSWPNGRAMTTMRKSLSLALKQRAFRLCGGTTFLRTRHDDPTTPDPFDQPEF